MLSQYEMDALKQIAKAVAGWEDAVRRVLREKND